MVGAEYFFSILFGLLHNFFGLNLHLESNLGPSEMTIFPGPTNQISVGGNSVDDIAFAINGTRLFRKKIFK